MLNSNNIIVTTLNNVGRNSVSMPLTTLNRLCVFCLCNATHQKMNNLFRVDENRTEQLFARQHCSMLSTVLNTYSIERFHSVPGD